MKSAGQVLLSPAALALVPTVIVAIFFLDIGSESRVEVTLQKADPMNQMVYYDLNGDRETEMIIGKPGTPFNNFPILNNEGKYYDQWNVPDELLPEISSLNFGDFDQDSRSEIYLFTAKADSIFLHVNEFFDPAGIRLTRVFVTTVNLVGGLNKATLRFAGLFDNNSDGKKELYFAVSTGFGLWPRLVYSFDLINLQMRTSPITGINFNQPSLFDLDGDGRPEVLSPTTASGNYHSPTPYSDYSAWLMVFDDQLKLKFEPVEFPGFGGTLDVFPLRQGPVTNLLCVYNNEGAGQPLKKPGFYFFSSSGNLLKESHWGNEKGFLKVMVHRGAEEDHIVICSNPLQVFNNSLELVKQTRIPMKDAFKVRLIDLNGDLNLELLLYSAEEESLVILSAEYEILGTLSVTLKEPDWHSSNFSDSNQGNKLFIKSGDRAYLLSLLQTAILSTGYLVLGAVYGKKDLAIANNGGNSSSGGNSISVFRNVSITGVILFEPKVDYYTGNNPLGVNIADLNGDHKPEIVTANGNSNTISILVNSTIPGILDFNSFFQKVDLPTPSGPINRVSIGDVNGDGKPDLAVVNLHGSSVSVFQNMILPSQFDLLSFSNRIDLPTANRPVGNEMSDLDRDGDLDLVVVHEATNTFNIYPNNGIPGSISESSFDPAIVLNKTGYSYVVSIGDLNNDGRAELVIGQGSNQVSIFPNIHPGNSAPVIHSIDLPEGAVKVNTPATIDVQFSDEGPVNAVVDWGDQSTSTFTNAQSILSASHEYQSAGLYPITVVLHDGCGLSSSSTAEYIVCFDPNGGFVAGTGWIRSPAGAYAPDPLLEGRANFLLAARYPNNWAMTPSGYTAFLFRAGNFVFSGSSLQWLVISDYKAQISGMGKVNGQGSYSFILTGIDGNKKEPQEDDRLRIKIRNLQTGMIIYDNHPGFSDLSDASTSLGAGNIFISSFSALNISGRISSDKEFATESTNGIVLYPNPAFSEAVIELPSDELISPITVEIKDKIGAFVRNEIFSGGTDKLTINVSDLPPGIYYCVVHTRNNTRTIRLAKE